MKISDTPKPPPVKKPTQADRAVDARGPANAAPVDEIFIAGIPEAELTPGVREALTSLMHEVQSLRDELSATRARMGELEELADRDPMLDVLNRRAFVRELSRTLALMDRFHTKASLVFVDLNDLKKINDTMGHAAGDAALEHVAQTIASNIRQTDAIGRLGGDELGIILTQTDQSNAELKASTLAELISSVPVNWKGEAFTAKIAYGAVEMIRGGAPDDLIEQADKAMYGSKNNQ